jgi:hypothetical protein
MNMRITSRPEPRAPHRCAVDRAEVPRELRTAPVGTRARCDECGARWRVNETALGWAGDGDPELTQCASWVRGEWWFYLAPWVGVAIVVAVLLATIVSALTGQPLR